MTNLAIAESLFITFGAAQLLIALLLGMAYRDSPNEGYGWLAAAFLMGAANNLLVAWEGVDVQSGWGVLRTINGFAGLGAVSALLVGARALAGLHSAHPWRWFVAGLVGFPAATLLLYAVAPASRPGFLVSALLFTYLALVFAARFRSEGVASLLVVAALLSMQPLVYLFAPEEMQRSLSALPFTVVGAAMLATGMARRHKALQEELRARIRAEQELRELNESLEHRVAERTLEMQDVIAGLTTFSGMVSHDLKAPLRGLGGLSDVLDEALERGDLDEARICVRRQNRLVGRMSELVTDLLRLSQMGLQPLQRARVSLSQPAREALAICLSAYPAMREEQVSLKVDTEALVDPGLLQQVFANLIGNAMKFSQERPQPRVEISARQESDAVVVCIRDNGVGFEPQKADRLFEPFSRLHTSHEGTGLGLTIVRRIVERHGGRVWAQSTPGEGASFFFSIPVQA